MSDGDLGRENRRQTCIALIQTELGEGKLES